MGTLEKKDTTSSLEIACIWQNHSFTGTRGKGVTQGLHFGKNAQWTHENNVARDACISASQERFGKTTTLVFPEPLPSTTKDFRPKTFSSGTYRKAKNLPAAFSNPDFVEGLLGSILQIRQKTALSKKLGEGVNPKKWVVLKKIFLGVWDELVAETVEGVDPKAVFQELVYEISKGMTAGQLRKICPYARKFYDEKIGLPYPANAPC